MKILIPRLLLLLSAMSIVHSHAQTYTIERLTPDQPLIDKQSFINLDPFTVGSQTYGFGNQGYLHQAPEGATLENGGWWTPPEGHNLKDYLWERISSPIRDDHENDPSEVAKNPRHFSHRIVGDTAHIFFHRRDDEPESNLS